MAYAEEVDRLAQIFVELRVKSELVRQVKEQVDYEDHYPYADDARMYLECCEAVRLLILHIRMLHNNDYPHQDELTRVLRATADLFSGQNDMNLKAYFHLANQVQGKPYLPHAGILAACMFTVGVAVFTVMLVLIAASTGPASPWLIVGLVLSLLVYFGSVPVMELKRPSGISKRATQVGDAAIPYEAMEKNHAAFFQQKDIAGMVVRAKDEIGLEQMLNPPEMRV